MLDENGFDTLGNFFQVTIQVDLLETAGDRIVDGVHVAISIRQRANNVNEFCFSTGNSRKKFISIGLDRTNYSFSLHKPVGWSAQNERRFHDDAFG